MANNPEKPYCKNCYHDSHGSTDMDACSVQVWQSGTRLDNRKACGCRNYIKWSRADSQREEAQMSQECEERLAKEHGVENNPKRGLLWAKAWEHGHSSGYSEVENYYRDFVELIE